MITVGIEHDKVLPDFFGSELKTIAIQLLSEYVST